MKGKNKLIIIIGVICLLLLILEFIPKKEANIPEDKRVDDLISRMTIDEKISQLHFEAASIPRLGIKDWVYLNEALHGVARFREATVFPQAIGLGSTWNPDLIGQMAHTIGIEARIFNNQTGKGLTYLSPTINNARDPRWGRTEESYSEDPYLTGRMGVAYVNGLQGSNPDNLLAGATLKHFIADNSDFQRYYSSSYADMRDIREYYMPSFEAAVKEGRSLSVMCTYRGLNGVPNCANKWLLKKVLREEWGFKGFVVSDCGAISDIVNKQHYVKEDEKAVQQAMLAGTDLDCGDYYLKYLKSAYEKGYINQSDIDTSLKRVLESRFRLGDFEPKGKRYYDNISDNLLNSDIHQLLALDIARESIVLMKNSNHTLPLKSNEAESIAVIGIKADDPEYGGYSGYPNQAITLLQGIQHKVGAGADGFRKIKAERFYNGSYIQKTIDYSIFEKADTTESDKIHMLQIKDKDWIMFKDIDLANGAKAFNLFAACEGNCGKAEIRLDKKESEPIVIVKVSDTGGWNIVQKFTAEIPEKNGIHDIYLSFIGDQDTLFNLESISFVPVKKNYTPTKTPVIVRYAKGSYVIGFDRSGFDEAIKIADESDKVIFVYGTDLRIAHEDLDRTSLDVPGLQRELLQKVLAVNPNVILVLSVGFPISIDWEKENIPAILGVWYPGQAQGTAVSDVLFGDYNPGGKLTMTWYKSADQLPDFASYKIRKNNRTYLYFKGDVLYPFGYGLSYTTFEYTNIKTDKLNYDDNENITLTFNIKNTGDVAGDEIAQLYYHDEESSVKTPIAKLIRFERVNIKPGETKTVSFTFPVQEMSYWDIKRNAMIVETGEFSLMVGSSSKDFKLTKEVFVYGKKYEQGIIRINAGGDYYIDDKGAEWMPDYGFTSGNFASTTDNVAGVVDPTIFQSCRKSCDIASMPIFEDPNGQLLSDWYHKVCNTTVLHYDFEVLDGIYDINFYFSEIEDKKLGDRIFDIEVEGKKVYPDLDIYKEAGSKKALIKQLKGIIVNDRYLDIDFKVKKSLPCVAGIEIIPVNDFIP